MSSGSTLAVKPGAGALQLRGRRGGAFLRKARPTPRWTSRSTSLREHYYTFEDASAATKIKEGGFADLAIKAADDAGEAIESLATESRIYGLGSGLFPEAFDQELVGMKKGQTKSFVIDVPAESSTLLAQVAGKTAKVAFDVEVKAVKTKELPEVTDEWAKDTLGFENVEDLRARIAESIAQQKADVLPRMKENACLAVLSERLEGEVPQAMAEDSETSLLQDFFQQLQRQNVSFDTYLMQQGITSDRFKEDVKHAGPRHGQAGPGAGRLGAPLRASRPPTPTWPPSSRRAAPKTPRRFRKNGARNGQLHLLREGIMRSNAMRDVMDKAQVTEIDFAAEKDEGDKKPAKKAAAKKAAKKAEKPAEAEAKPAKKAAPHKKAAKKADAEPEPAAAAEDGAAQNA